MISTFNRIILFILFISFNTTLLNGQNEHKIEDAIFDSDNLVSQEVLIILEDQATLELSSSFSSKDAKGSYVYNTLSALAKESQKDIINVLISKGAIHKSHYLVNSILTKIDRSTIIELSNRKDVKYIISNAPYLVDIPRPEPINSSRNADIEWGVVKIQADSVWTLGYNGDGVVVGGADTGYDWDHSAIKSNYRGWNGTDFDHNYNWFDAIVDPEDGTENDCGYQIDEPCDDFGHGTHTMGTMVGETEDHKIGVAPGATWIGARNMNNGYGTPETYIACFEFFIAPTDLQGENADPMMAPHVINNSWGCPPSEGCNQDNFNIMEMVVENVKAAGIVVVVSAGNSGSGCGSVSSPAAIYEASFTVGATNDMDTLAGFSSRGPVFVDGSERMKPNVSAPGVQVYSCIRDEEYATFNGTSMAGPHVAGAVALMISANPAIAGHVEDIETILEATAVALFKDEECGGLSGQNIPNPYYGFGRIDALAAVQGAINWTLISNEYIEGNKIQIGPNPAQNYINIFDLNNVYSSVELFNIKGQSIQMSIQSITSGFTLDISHLEQGVYFGVLNSKTGRHAFKFIKN